MTDTEICRLCAESVGMTAHHEDRCDWHTVGGGKWLLDNWNPLDNFEQAAQVRWKLLELGYQFEQSFDTLRIYPPEHKFLASQLCLTILDEYRLLAETLARHQEGTKK